MVGRPREFSDSAVVDAAMDLFWEKGYEATTTQGLCERTGVGRGSLYNAFGSKHRLYEEAVRRYAKTWAAKQPEMLARPGPVKERLRELMVGVIDADLADPGRRGCLALNAAIEVSGRGALVRRQFLDLERALTNVVETGQRTGGAAHGPPGEPGGADVPEHLLRPARTREGHRRPRCPVRRRGGCPRGPLNFRSGPVPSAGLLVTACALGMIAGRVITALVTATFFASAIVIVATAARSDRQASAVSKLVLGMAGMEISWRRRTRYAYDERTTHANEGATWKS